MDYISQNLDNIQYQLTNHPVMLDNSLFYDVFGYEGGHPGQVSLSEQCIHTQNGVLLSKIIFDSKKSGLAVYLVGRNSRCSLLIISTEHYPRMLEFIFLTEYI